MATFESFARKEDLGHSPAKIWMGKLLVMSIANAVLLYTSSNDSYQKSDSYEMETTDSTLNNPNPTRFIS